MGGRINRNTHKNQRYTLLSLAFEILEPGQAGDLVPLTVDEDPSLPSIDVNGTLLHSEGFGDPRDPMIVVLHGGPGRR